MALASGRPQRHGAFEVLDSYGGFFMTRLCTFVFGLLTAIIINGCTPAEEHVSRLCTPGEVLQSFL